MTANKITQIPEVDEKMRVLNLHTWNHLEASESYSHSMIIMSGGRGTRLLPLTENCPKPMLEIGGKPILEIIIEKAKLEGFKHFTLAVHYLAHIIEDYFGDGKKIGVRIDYIRETVPLGTAGPLSLIETPPTSNFIVTNADVLSQMKYSDLLSFHINQDAHATMAVNLHKWQHPFGIVKLDGMVIEGFDEKPIFTSYINSGIYALSPAALTYLDVGKYCDMPDLFMKLRSHNKNIRAYPIHESWRDVGRPSDYYAIKSESTILS
jgi:NDP-sugar pyrophosphorylase family protein